MPFTQISLLKGKSLDYRRNLMEEVYLAMRESINIPENDRFATITEHDIVFIQITLNGGRTTDKKKALYATIAERLHTNLGIRKEDVVISLLEISQTAR